jgi:hypothetical protein
MIGRVGAIDLLEVTEPVSINAMIQPLKFSESRKQLLPALATLLLVAITAYELRRQGRLWVCSCGALRVWQGDIWSAENSQQILDPYSFTHLLHGFIFFGLLAWLAPRLLLPWRLWLALSFEALWEIVENTNYIIERYRGVTAAIGYQGDTVLNSLGDVMCFAVGFLLARRLGARLSLLVFLIIEAALIIWIKDSLLLNVIMLIYPIQAIKIWQLAH